MFGFNKDPDPETPPVTTPPVADPNQPPTPEPEGLDKFASLFNTKKDDDNPPTDPPTEDVIFDPTTILEDPEAVTALLSKLDFTKDISPETQAKLQANDPSATMDLFNEIGKQAYLSSLKHTTALMKRHVDDRFAQQDGVVSTKINSSIKSADLAAQIPEISNPIVALGVQPFIDRLQSQNPTMSTADVVKQVKSYLGELNSTINPPPKESTPDKDKEVDWLEDLGL